MACPGTAGVLAQLYDAYRQTHSGQDPHGGLMKAILMNTSDDLGQPGPDFIHGYGRMNALRAAKSIEQNQFMKDSLSPNETDTVRIAVPAGTQAVRVMLHWTDPAATVNAGRALVNNLNGVLKQGSSTWLPWVLNPTPNATSLNSPAVRAVDSLNTAEQFEVLNPTPGDFDLVINGSIAVGSSQEYFVTWSFVAADVELTYPVGGEVLVAGQTTPVRWDSEPNGSTYQLSASYDNGATWTVVASPGANADQANWAVPAGVNDQMWLRIVRGTQGDTTDVVLSRIGVPTNLNHQWTCPDSFKVSWNPVVGATGYVVYRLGAAYMDPVDTVTATSYVFTGSNPNVAEWFSVAALTPAGRAGKRAVAVEKPAGIQGCIVTTDAALSAIINPQGRMPDCQALGSIPVEVRLLNPAIQSLTSVPVAVRVGSGPVLRDTVSVQLTSTQSSVVQLAPTLSLPGIGTYSLRVWTELAGDQNPYNDTLTTSVFVTASGTPVVLPYSENFGSFVSCPTTSNCGVTTCTLTGGWVNATNGSEDQHDWRTDAGGTPTTGTGPTGGANGGGPTDNYLYLEATNCLNSTGLVFTPCINLANTSLPQLSFSANMLGSNQGELHVDVLSGGRWHLDVCAPLIGNKGSAWVNATASLMAFSGQVIVVRFRGITGNGGLSDIALDAITVSEVTSAPQAAMQLPSAAPCLNQVVQLVDVSTNSPSSWRWIITPRSGVSFANGTDSTSKNPWVSFGALGSYNVQLIATNSFGSDTAVSASSIALTAGAPLPFAEAFGPSLPLGWTVDNPDGGITWAVANSIGSSGVSTNAMTVNFFNYSSTLQEDGLITPGIDLSGTTLPYLVFDVAYAPYDASYIDGLRVEYSTNCGTSWQPTGYAKSGSALATKAAQTTTFTPSLASHWRRDSIALPSSISGPSVKFRFVGMNGYGNNLFVDNIQVYDLGASAPVASISASATSDVCVLDTVYFSAVNPGNALAQWTFGPGAVPSVATGPGNHAVYFFSPGTKTVTLQLNGSGGTDRDTISLNAEPNLVGAWSFQTDSAFVFRGQASVSQGTALNYLWDFGDGSTATTAAVRHVYAAAGTYPVQLTVDGPCNDIVFQTSASISSIGLDEPEHTWNVAPNPTSGMVRIGGADLPDGVRVIDLAGRTVLVGRANDQGQLDLTELASGSYVLELQRGQILQRSYLIKH
jgi:PKD repeat protein